MPAGVDYYQATIDAGDSSRHDLWLRSVSVAFGASFALIPMLVFFNLWPNWGSTLYGEVRGASDYKRNFWGMASAIIVTAGLALVFFLLIDKTIGWDFYINANGAFWSNIFYGTEVAIPVWPYPVQFATFLTSSRLVQFLVIFAVGFWWIGWSGTVFLSSTRVIFAAALDRMLPEWVSKIEPRTKTPDQRPAADGHPVGDHLDHVRLQYREDADRSCSMPRWSSPSPSSGRRSPGIIFPWKQKAIFDGSPISKYKAAAWLGWIVTVLYLAAARIPDLPEL